MVHTVPMMAAALIAGAGSSLCTVERLCTVLCWLTFHNLAAESLFGGKMCKISSPVATTAVCSQHPTPQPCGHNLQSIPLPNQATAADTRDVARVLRRARCRCDTGRSLKIKHVALHVCTQGSRACLATTCHGGRLPQQWYRLHSLHET
jgi:hypothetical protein